ncbi:MAG: hypothetical protein ACRDV9_09695 [Acidimicrobiia bacterium]
MDDLHDVAALTGGTGAEELLSPDPKDQVPVGATGVLDRVAEARRDVISSLEPGGDSGAAAVLEALESEMAGARRRLGELAGGTPAGEGRLVLAPPAPAVIVTDTTSQDMSRRLKQLDVRNDDPSIERVVVQGEIDADLFALACLALLADPGARARLAPKLSPADIPEVTAVVAEEEHLGSTTRQAWQEAIFDDQGRVVLTPSTDPRYTLFRAWAEKVNPGLWRYANAVLDRMMSR